MKHLPGTMIETRGSEYKNIFNSIFLTGGITLSQLSNITGLEAHTIQNWVKRKYLSAPINKKYSQNQLCRVIIINMLKEVFSIDEVCSLMDYINIYKANERQNFICESNTYFYFTDALFHLNDDIENLDKSIEWALKGYVETQKGEQKRLADVLEIMISAYISYSYKQKASLLYRSKIFRGE